MHKGKSKILDYNTENTKPITLDKETVENIIDKCGASEADVKVKIGRARKAFLKLKNIWNSKQLFTRQYQSQNLQYECQNGSTVRN
ncbi:unnamed protein product [Schistosoma curassoni]|uniref:Transposase n=1 Tax=Schistosoma curassoni TaxID=6186 RepID=A0A183K233_9TREM|nr:unnamed protein product [Schistosoma curassoni]